MFQGLMVGHAAAACVGLGLGGSLNNGGVHAVTGEGGDTGLGAGRYQNVVVLQIGVLVAVVHLQSAHGGGKHGQSELAAEQRHRGVGVLVLADGVHVDAQLLPLLVVADGAGAQALGAGAGNGILAGNAVANGARFAVGAHDAAGLLQNFLISHSKVLPYSIKVGSF